MYVRFDCCSSWLPPLADMGGQSVRTFYVLRETDSGLAREGEKSLHGTPGSVHSRPSSHTSSHSGVNHGRVILHRCDGLRTVRIAANIIVSPGKYCSTHKPSTALHTSDNCNTQPNRTNRRLVLRTAMGMVQFAAAPIRPTVLTNFSDTTILD